ncbi:MAG: 50S ribosomal protein L17 [Deltaproteobacteria bacterium HGW-Deltaproteobacteria-21]|nr:MAG: 50S ribosomal protein L17 [Deltaproteobacteria bacterium HGW-Deltaproteobacteria-21]
MRHLNSGRQLSRNSSHRRAMMRNIVTSLFKHEQIETTDAKAKELRSVAEKIITLAKRGDLHARRQALAYLTDKTVAHKVFEELKTRYLNRQGGYLRIVKKMNRKGDGAPVSIVQLLPGETAADKKRKKGKTSAPESKPKLKKGAEVKEKEKTVQATPDQPPETKE